MGLFRTRQMLYKSKEAIVFGSRGRDWTSKKLVLKQLIAQCDLRVKDDPNSGDVFVAG